MQDHNSVGRLTNLSPVTWRDGWPYFGLPGNLTRTPATWVKPNTGSTSQPTAPYDRTDNFADATLKPVWQWNHHPVEEKWSLTERPGYLRLHSLPASDFWWARNTLTQRAIGPESVVTTEVDVRGMKPGDTAGLALLNRPYAWIGIVRDDHGLSLRTFDQTTNAGSRAAITRDRVWLRVKCDFDTEKAQFSYSEDGTKFLPIGGDFTMVFQLKTFQGVRYGLFHYSKGGTSGGYVDFNGFDVDEPRPRGLSRPIPFGESVVIRSLSNGHALTVLNGSAQSTADPKSATRFAVIDRGRGRVALRAADGRFLSVTGAGTAGEVRMRQGEPGVTETFQWTDLHRGDTMLLSLATHRYLRAPRHPGPLSADHPGPEPDRKDGACFRWDPSNE
jgi:hypothetical protein